VQVESERRDDKTIGDGNEDEDQEEGKHGTGTGTNSAAEMKKVWEGTRTVGTKEKRERANERALVDFALPFSFLLPPHSCISSFLFIWIHSVLISSPLPVPILSCVRLASGGAANPEPKP